MTLRLEKIHSDDRGDINIIVGDSLKHHEEVTIFTTRKGVARGGCIHKINDEYNIVIEGTIEYLVGSSRHVYNKGDVIIIPKNTPHYFISLTNSIVIEWGATSEEKKEKHKKTREEVLRINENGL